MSNKITTAYSSELKLSQRLEPRYYYNQNLLKSVFNKFGIQEIKDFATLKSGSTPEHHDEKNNSEDIYFIKSADVKRYNLNFSTISFILKETHSSRLNSKVIPNDVLLSNTGKYLGFACIVPNIVKEANINQNIIRIRLNKESNTKFTPHFLLAFLNSQFGQIEIEAILTLTGQKYLNMKKFSSYKIPKIEKTIIEKITFKIKDIENNEIEALSLIEQAQNFFYKKVGLDFLSIKKENFYSANSSDFNDISLWTPAYSNPLYKNTLDIIQKKWQTKSIREIATVKKGNEVGSDNYNKYLNKKNRDVPFIRTSDLVNYEVDQFPDFYISEEIYHELKQDVTIKDILFSNDGKIGHIAMLTPQDKVILQSHIKRIRLKKEAMEQYGLTQEYLFLILSIKEITKYQAARYTVIQSTIPTISNHILDFRIPVLDKDSIGEITKFIKNAFILKTDKKKIIKEISKEIDNYFAI